MCNFSNDSDPFLTLRTTGFGQTCIRTSLPEPIYDLIQCFSTETLGSELSDGFRHVLINNEFEIMDNSFRKVSTLEATHPLCVHQYITYLISWQRITNQLSFKPFFKKNNQIVLARDAKTIFLLRIGPCVKQGLVQDYSQRL